MRQRSMRPQDIVILLKIASLESKNWLSKDIAKSLYISPGEVSESLSRSSWANLIDHDKTRVNKQNLLDFIKYGLPYVFPPFINSTGKGIPTSHSHPFMKQYFESELTYVWPDAKGNARGLILEPFYENQTKAVREDSNLYKLLALVDVMRIGRTREKKVAEKELENILLNKHESSNQLDPH